MGNKLQKSMNSSDPPQKKTHPERPSDGNWNTRKRLETINKTVSLEGKGECTATDW